MSLVEDLGLRALRLMDPERAHRLALEALVRGLVPRQAVVARPRLATQVAGLDIANPVGLAAGFDKNGIALSALSEVGFGFLEMGGTTPRPQPGNPKPRLFRLPKAEAVINRFGFNNEGMEVMGRRLAAKQVSVPVGLNLGANKDSVDRAADFVTVLRHCGAHVDFATVNVSSPNTEALRDLQGKAALAEILRAVLEIRGEAGPKIFVKIAPDLSDAEIADIAHVAQETGIDGIIATNTTLERPLVDGPNAAQKGGLSGRPLMSRSTQVLARLAQETGGAMPLIGVGGIASAEDAYAKIRAGASAVQLYTALAYQGLSLVPRIVDGLDALLERDGFAHVSEAVGVPF